MNKKIFYQLVASGPLENFSGGKQIRSKRVFPSREAAEAEIVSFRAKCVGTGIFDLEDSPRTTVTISELELVD